MKMVRTTLLAAAAGVLISPALMAGDINSESGDVGWSDELLGLAVTDDQAWGGGLTLILGAEYAVGDIIRLEFSGSALDPASLPANIVSVCVDPATAPPNGRTGVTLGLLNSSADAAEYRVTELDTTCGGTSTINKRMVFDTGFADQILFDAPAVLDAGTVTVSFSARTGFGDALDTGGTVDRSTDYLQTYRQDWREVDFAFDAVVDVEQERKFLLPGPSDSAQFSYDDAAASDARPDGLLTWYEALYCDPAACDYYNVDYVWSGSFGWIEDTDEVAAGIQPAPGVVDTFPCLDTPTVTATTITGNTCWSFWGYLQLNPTAQGSSAVLPSAAFQVSAEFNYWDTVWDITSTAFTAYSNVAAGRWGLNGFYAEIPYMPYGSTISQVIYLANRGSQDGDVTVDWIARDGTGGSLGVVGTLNAGSTLSIGNAIKTALPAAKQAGGRLALTVTVNAPAEDVQINSQYNVSGNRAFTLHDDNRPSLASD